ARVTLAERGQKETLRQRIRLLEQLGRHGDAPELNNQFTPDNGRSTFDLMLEANDLVAQGKFPEAWTIARRVAEERPTYYQAWFVMGYSDFQLGRLPEAEACFSVCVALRPDSPWARFNRGLMRTRMQKWQDAEQDFNQALDLWPDDAETLLNRAIVRREQNNLAGAEADLTRVLELPDPPSKAYFLRADVRRRRGNDIGATQDYDQGMTMPPTDEASWIERGLARLEREPKAALDDFNAALQLNPRSRDALQNKAHVLAEHLHQLGEAITVLDRLIELYPDFLLAYGSRGVYHARLGHIEAARRDADYCLSRDHSPFGLYQQASLLALLARHDPAITAEALRVFEQALQSGFNDLDLIDSDSDIDAIRSHPQFRRLIASARQKHQHAPKK
ncbi:MAG: tetratricopeptide repeat protein, partial [Gemmataceae bacterium]|nr:tetratricopeptide repeat protein [Gemmataceae bacterium]